VAGIDGDRGGTGVDFGLEVALITRFHIGVGLQSGTNVGGGEVAGSILSSVRIGSFSVDSLVGDDVVHGLSHETSITTQVSIGI